MGSFDITQRSIAMPLVSGGELHLFEPRLRDPSQILRTIAHHGITRINCAPSSFYPLVENTTQSTFESLNSLKTVFLGGEPISASPQVKIRGYRIHLGDTEANLRRFSQMREAVVLKTDRAGDDQLMAYIVPADQPNDNLAADAKAFLRQRLPEHMVPATAVVIEKLPLNPNGKIDRKAVLRLTPAPETPPKAPKETRPSIEQEVSSIFAESLNLAEVGPDDDCFDLGGNSLKAVLVVANVANRIGAAVPLETLFETRALRKFCQLIATVAH
jgi:acyl-coenzyme A synthetase/AMP-(fatty) acid ligase/acyl carrier protein